MLSCPRSSWERGKACDGSVWEISDFRVAASLPDALCFPAVGYQATGGLAVVEMAGGVISDLKPKLVPWGCTSFLECGLSGVCPRGGIRAQGACGQARPALSLPQTSLSCLALLFGALCSPEQVKGNARLCSLGSWWLWPWCGGPADRGSCRGGSWLIMPQPGDTNGSGVGPNPGQTAVLGQSQVLCCRISVPFTWAAAFGVQAMGLAFPSHI